MKIRILPLENFGGTHISTGTQFAEPGDVVEVPDDEGEVLCAAGMAEAVEDDLLEEQPDPDGDGDGESGPGEDEDGQAVAEPDPQDGPAVPPVVEEPAERAVAPAPKRERRTTARKTPGGA